MLTILKAALILIAAPATVSFLFHQRLINPPTRLLLSGDNNVDAQLTARLDKLRRASINYLPSKFEQDYLKSSMILNSTQPNLGGVPCVGEPSVDPSRLLQAMGNDEYQEWKDEIERWRQTRH